MHATSRERIYGLDVYRAVAILLVLLLHSRFILEGTTLAGLPFVRIPDGVELFFVLSGFLIGGILLRTIEQQPAPDHGTLVSFWLRRWFRTLPAYYLILAVNYVLVRYNVIHEGIYNFSWKYFLFLQNFAKPFVGFYRESWSLSVEEWFYVIVPVLLFILVRFVRLQNAYLIAVAIMLVAPVICRVVLMDSNFDSFWVDLSIRKVVITRLDSIGYGLLVAWFYHYYRDICERYSWPAFFIGLVGSVVLLVWRLPAGSIFSQVIYFSLSPALMSFMLPLAAGLKAGKGRLAGFFTFTSRISYSLYLINFSLIAEVIRDQMPPYGGWDGIAKYALFWMAAYAGATLLYYTFEKPVMDLRDR